MVFKRLRFSRFARNGLRLVCDKFVVKFGTDQFANKSLVCVRDKPGRKSSRSVHNLSRFWFDASTSDSKNEVFGAQFRIAHRLVCERFVSQTGLCDEPKSLLIVNQALYGLDQQRTKQNKSDAD